MGKFDPPITITTGRNEQGMQFDSGRSIDNNEIYDRYMADLGIQVKNSWVVNNAEAYTNKANISIASGDIPDILAVSPLQLKKLVEADMIEDLTDVYSKYATQELKDLFMEDGGVAMKASSYQGKLYALPMTVSAIDGSDVLWVRSDWIKKLGLSDPKSMDDVYKIAKAFVEQDPDGNQKADTFGIGLSKELNTSGSPSIGGFFNAFHAYPGIWVKDANGQLSYGSIQPEMKDAILKLAEMYKAGMIDKEFGVKDVSKVYESINSGKVGLFYGDMAATLYANNGTKKNDPGADWNAYPIPSADETPAKVSMNMPITVVYVVKKGFKNPEALVKLMNYYNEKNWVNPDPTISQNPETGVFYYPYNVVQASKVMKNIDAHRKVKAALIANDPAGLNSEEKMYYDKIDKWRKDPSYVEGWMFYKVFGMDHAGLEAVDSYVVGNQLQQTTFLGGSTPAMSEKMATLDKMEKVMMTKIILGSGGTEAFDKFVSDWKKLGGDQITKEVNEWAAAAGQ
ncbi:extracellular solute-binding protein [Cohnella rhizosphaerae]|uniref:Extracellular solute-binding protein n=1 Tax=Cohnella rhizosphaerae TaxID=1457232 RepID=A0A9X4QWU2_9BACL|nr:extracellular solute-binding protein [Cohnella rhizosphaerae]MDG0812727.1 extracellular solute-binding protein [Cohnella rhizosphaerae]